MEMVLAGQIEELDNERLSVFDLLKLFGLKKVVELSMEYNKA